MHRILNVICLLICSQAAYAQTFSTGAFETIGTGISESGVGMYAEIDASQDHTRCGRISLSGAFTLLQDPNSLPGATGEVTCGDISNAGTGAGSVLFSPNSVGGVPTLWDLFLPGDWFEVIPPLVPVASRPGGYVRRAQIFGISPDGIVGVGLDTASNPGSASVPVVWDNSGIFRMTSVEAINSSSVDFITMSPDGTRAAGEIGLDGWRVNALPTGTATALSGTGSKRVRGITNDGTVLGSINGDSAYWPSPSGAPVVLATHPQCQQFGFANDASTDLSVIIGQCPEIGTNQLLGIVWVAGGLPVLAKDWLESRGVTLPFGANQRPILREITPDGMRVVGTERAAGRQALYTTVPEPGLASALIVGIIALLTAGAARAQEEPEPVTVEEVAEAAEHCDHVPIEEAEACLIEAAAELGVTIPDTPTPEVAP